jgi:hypothetical protein
MKSCCARLNVALAQILHYSGPSAMYESYSDGYFSKKCGLLLEDDDGVGASQLCRFADAIKEWVRFSPPGASTVPMLIFLSTGASGSQRCKYICYLYGCISSQLCIDELVDQFCLFLSSLFISSAAETLGMELIDSGVRYVIVVKGESSAKDRALTEFMRQFYFRLLQGDSVVAALHAGNEAGVAAVPWYVFDDGKMPIILLKANGLDGTESLFPRVTSDQVREARQHADTERVFCRWSSNDSNLAAPINSFARPDIVHAMLKHFVKPEFRYHNICGEPGVGKSTATTMVRPVCVGSSRNVVSKTVSCVAMLQALQHLVQSPPRRFINQVRVRHFDCAQIYAWWDQHTPLLPNANPGDIPAASGSLSHSAATSPFQQYVMHTLLESLPDSGYMTGHDVNTSWQLFLETQGKSCPELYLFFDRTDEYCHTQLQAADFRAVVVQLLNIPRIQVRHFQNIDTCD